MQTHAVLHGVLRLSNPAEYMHSAMHGVVNQALELAVWFRFQYHMEPCRVREVRSGIVTTTLGLN